MNSRLTLGSRESLVTAQVTQQDGRLSVYRDGSEQDEKARTGLLYRQPPTPLSSKRMTQTTIPREKRSTPW